MKNTKLTLINALCFHCLVQYVHESYWQFLTSDLIFTSSLMLHGLFVLRVLKKSFGKNLQLALLFQILFERYSTKNLNNFFMRTRLWYIYETVQTGIILTIAASLLGSYKFLAVRQFVLLIMISFNLLFFPFRQLSPTSAIYSEIGDNENASALSCLMTFPDWTKNDVKAPRVYLLTPADFVFSHLETFFRSTISNNDFFFLIRH